MDEKEKDSRITCVVVRLVFVYFEIAHFVCNRDDDQLYRNHSLLLSSEENLIKSHNFNIITFKENHISIWLYIFSVYTYYVRIISIGNDPETQLLIT